MSNWIAFLALIVSASAWINTNKLNKRLIKRMDEEEKEKVRPDLSLSFDDGEFKIENDGLGTAFDVKIEPLGEPKLPLMRNRVFAEIKTGYYESLPTDIGGHTDLHSGFEVKVSYTDSTGKETTYEKTIHYS
ncbi:MAG: hypothetical protein HRT88_21580 [Lentisphaeraceae bacterium]|nr:hypothetical protein [Lentisphaeraceae bacterium]